MGRRCTCSLELSGRFAVQATSLAGELILADLACIAARILGAILGELFVQRGDGSARMLPYVKPKCFADWKVELELGDLSVRRGISVARRAVARSRPFPAGGGIGVRQQPGRLPCLSAVTAQ